MIYTYLLGIIDTLHVDNLKKELRDSFYILKILLNILYTINRQGGIYICRQRSWKWCNSIPKSTSFDD